MFEDNRNKCLKGFPPWINHTPCPYFVHAGDHSLHIFLYHSPFSCLHPTVSLFDHLKYYGESVHLIHIQRRTFLWLFFFYFFVLLSRVNDFFYFEGVNKGNSICLTVKCHSIIRKQKMKMKKINNWWNTYFVWKILLFFTVFERSDLSIL